jgi:hypothetical protein
MLSVSSADKIFVPLRRRQLDHRRRGIGQSLEIGGLSGLHDDDIARYEYAAKRPSKLATNSKTWSVRSKEAREIGRKFAPPEPRFNRQYRGDTREIGNLSRNGHGNGSREGHTALRD